MATGAKLARSRFLAQPSSIFQERQDVIASTKTIPFEIDPDGVDPAAVPKRTLYTGAKIPVIGLGTFGSDRFSGEQVAEAVLEAASVGYRHFDCASVYRQ